MELALYYAGDLPGMELVIDHASDLPGPEMPMGLSKMMLYVVFLC